MLTRVLATLFLITAFTATTAVAQQWSAEQQEVWKAEVECLKSGIDDVETRKACVHPDFVGWGIEGPIPTSFSESRFDYYFKRNKLKVIDAEPLHILVEGDLAVIQLMVRDVTSTNGEPDRVTWEAWTDVMRRENGQWRWIADHGHLLESAR